MKYSISDDIFNQATECKRKSECLNGRKCDCDVVRIVSDLVAIVKCTHPSQCNYQTYFGNGIFCTCPVRVELASKYGV